MKLKQTQLILNAKKVFEMSWKRCSKAMCVPKYAQLASEKRKILKIYIEAQIANYSRKGKFEVDHIIPLNNQYVCGLHVASNLQVISQAKNTNKSNYFTPYRQINGRKYFYNELRTGRAFVKKRKSYNPTKKNNTKLAKKVQKRVGIRSKAVKTVQKRVKR